MEIDSSDRKEMKVPVPLGSDSSAELVAENQTLKAAVEALKREVQDLQEEMRLRKDIELQLVNSQKMEALGQMAAGIAHEINTPAQFIGDHLYFVKESINEILNLDEGQEGPSEFVRENLPMAVQHAIEGIERIGNIVASMRRFSHRERDQEKHPSDLNQALLDSVSVSRNQWKNNAVVETELDPDLPLVPCLLGEVNQVLLNLIINATHAVIDFKGKGKIGQIILRTKQLDNEVQIEVEDDGGGIPKDIQERIFEPFFTTKGLGQGTGQGLALAHSVIVKKHGGRLTFDTQEGVGTTFFLLLPISADSQTSSSQIPYCKGWPKISS